MKGPDPARFQKRPVGTRLVDCLFALVVLWSAAPATAANSGSESPSNATNYQSGAQLAVQERTGTVTVKAELFSLSGIAPESDLNLSLSYRQSDALSASSSNTRYFGLPYGWYFNLSFISAGDSYSTLLVDGEQEYVLDSDWRTVYTPSGSDDEISVATGLLQYNQVDANLRADSGTVTVGNVASAYVYTTVDGTRQYFSDAGLLIQRADRFGNTIDFHYRQNVPAQFATLTSIVDSWGHTITLEYCDEGEISDCEAGEVVVTLPDGRTVGWVASDDARLTKVLDALGDVTVLDYDSTGCQTDAQMIRGLTAPAGGMVAVTYACMPVCTTASSTSCSADGNTTAWPVVDTLYECPSNTSGAECPDGTADDYNTTVYEYGDAPNYTGYPLYSPYDSTVYYADSLMSSNDSGFTYKTTVSRKDANGTIKYQTINEYNFLHLMIESEVYVRAKNSSGSYELQLGKQTSQCYQLTDSNTVDCDSNDADYQNLPANYQTPVLSGSCVYNVGPDVTTTDARRSLVSTLYDGFGDEINKKTYHGTSATGISNTCDRNERLNSSGLDLVLDEYTDYDLPSKLSGRFLDLGEQAYGLITGAMTYAYLDADETGGQATALIGESDDALLVTLTCSSLTTSDDAAGEGAAVKTSTAGSMTRSTEPPGTPGIVPYCDDPLAWDDSVASPKTSSYGYDQHGRTTSKGIAWALGYPAGDGIDNATEYFSFDMTDGEADDEACGDGGQVMQITHTDQDGYTSISRTCTLNGFLASVTDAEDRTMRMRHDALGNVIKTIQPNGTYSESTYYYACPRGQLSRTRTCPTDSRANQDCPYDDDGDRSCMVASSYAGTNPDTGKANTTFADGVMSVSIKDGLGRVIMSRDNLGGQVGSGYSEMQTTGTTTYDGLGLQTNSASILGSSDPLVYTTTVSYGPKLRPSLECEPRGNAQQYDHDDVHQSTKWYMNGSGREAYSINDSEKLTQIASCGLVEGEAVAATAELMDKLDLSSSSSCPTITDTSTTDTGCGSGAYLSQFALDGFGLVHSITTSSGSSSNDDDSITSVAGVATFSADRMKQAYSLVSKASASSKLLGADDLVASSTTSRDLLGQVTQSSVSIDSGNGDEAASTDKFTFDNRSLMTRAESNLSSELANTYTYTPTRMLSSTKSYAGVEFHNYYNDIDQLVRTCFASKSGGTEGERYTYDAITNQVLSTTHYTNPNVCSECKDNDCGDVDGDWVSHTYTRFGAPESTTYSDGTTLRWAYDQYQRPSCFADALATHNGNTCPELADFQ